MKWIPILALLFLAAHGPVMRFAAGQTPPPPPQPGSGCWRTQPQGKCGTDYDVGPVGCGGQTCFSMMVRFGNLNHAASSEDGFKDRAIQWCTKTVVTQECQNGVCTVLSIEESQVVQGSVAVGAFCDPPH